MSDHALTIRGLTKRFAGFQLGPLDLTVPTGAIYGFIGPNGAGKSTTIDLIMGMGRKDDGTITVLGFDHAEQEVDVKLRVGYVSPELNFNAWGKVGRAIGFFKSFYPDWDDAYCMELLGRMKLDPGERISTLSYGSRTKLAVMLALSHRPPLLLLDEPLAGLDAVAKHEVFTELLAAVQDESRTVFISSHNLDDLERFADHIGIINDGKLLLEGPTSDLVERFRMVDAVATNGAEPSRVAGVRVVKRDGPRWRLLVDTTANAMERLRNDGLTDLTVTPITLEELFVALVKEE